MLTILFWNIGGRRKTPSKPDLQGEGSGQSSSVATPTRSELRARIDILVTAAREHDVDILILAEYPRDGIADLLRAINQKDVAEFSFSSSNCKLLTIVTRFPSSYIYTRQDGPRFTIREVRHPTSAPFLLAAVHLPSRLNQDQVALQEGVGSFADKIRNVEQLAGHQRTIVVGDFNVSPFEPGMVGARGLHAVSTRHRAQQITRTIGGDNYPFFYNPMWRFFGDDNPRPPGTYHYSSSSYIEHFWHIFDQVLLRPSLLDVFVDDSLIILHAIGSTSLVNTSNFIPSAFSDHLPIVFSIRTEQVIA